MKKELPLNLKDIFTAAEEANNLILKSSQSSLEDYMSSLSEKLDKFVEKSEKDKEISFIAGEVGVEYINDNEFRFVGELYFKNKNGELLKENLSGRPSYYIHHLDEYSTDRIKTEKIIKFEYNK
ncbi:hypothetical protein QRD40_24065 [Comamonas sp. Y6]|uniref:Uncharacterized protein n=1 Tax=Comamonas resistens TaxID=3046670 RepID=A0ABY8T020_9BURK|nr:hypothetical protein [Comamonas resistens]MDL5039410.1 hypothetical protein [Comamonas resistens]WHS68060.1 hypothetical protein QMY55_24545 [Comamonas resistens]